MVYVPLILLAAFSAGGPSELLEPVRILAGGKPIDVEVGHAAPCFADFDGDGLEDLLVGQFGGGKLRIYKNAGTGRLPRFDDFSIFQADGKEGTVPSG